MKFKKSRKILANYLMQAFSLVELMVTLVVISVIMSALVPSITKKLKSQGITVGGSIGGGGGSSGGSSSDYDPNLTMDCTDNFGENCELCYTNACISCNLVCTEGEYKNVAMCSCLDCKGVYGNFCEDCNENKCIRCQTGYGLTSGGGCTSAVCPDGQYSDNGATLCKDCESGYYCVNGIKNSCEADEYSLLGAESCIKCSTAISNCDRCTSANNCASCEAGFSLENNSCVLSMESVEYTQAGTYSLIVPDGITQMLVTLVSGGAGGGAGAIYEETETFVVSGSGNSANDTHNKLHVNSTGLFTWTIPTSVRGKSVQVWACGGGGGGGGQYAGGRGGIINNVTVPMPNQETIGIIIGGGGGGGLRNGNCAYGGGSGNYWSSSANFRYTSCGASGSWGAGGQWHSVGGYGGYDPVFNEHGVGGGAAGTNNAGTGTAGKGSRVGGGGGAGDNNMGSSSYIGGGGGGATLFKQNNLALVQAYVAPGGGGGSTNGTGDSGGGGGGGGGIGGGKGGWSPTTSDGGGTAGGAGTGNGTNVFGASYCAGGSAGTSGKNGAMRIYYVDKPNGGSGGGAGHMVINQLISVIPNDTLTITVGRGGKGGSAGYFDSSGTLVLSTNGENASSEMISKILNGKGATLITSAPNISIMGNTGGSTDGSTVGEKGFISDGVSTTDLGSSDNYSNEAGTIANGTTGGAGGQTYLGDDSVIHCAARQGGELENDAVSYFESEYGGCGGAGGGAGADGGDGAQGYVKITIVRDDN